MKPIEQHTTKELLDMRQAPDADFTSVEILDELAARLVTEEEETEDPPGFIRPQRPSL
jgi:hypothetical protein